MDARRTALYIRAPCLLPLPFVIAGLDPAIQEMPGSSPGMTPSMHDLRWIRDHPAEFDRGLTRRGLPPRAEEILALDRRWRAAETDAQEAQARRNRVAREIGAAKKRGEADRRRCCARSSEDKDVEAATPARRRRNCAPQIDEILAGLPNLPAEEVPDGPDETANRVLRHHGEPPRFDFAPLSHEAIGERLGMMDFARAGKLSGSRFVVLRGALARLERALGQFMLDLHTTEFGYTEVSPPCWSATKRCSGSASCRNSPRICSAPPTAIG